jgi:TusA-related sulfurtransferase
MKKEIKLNTTIAELLNEYEGMKDILISINPKFKKLNNPILRRTLAKVATVKQAAFIGGMEPVELLNKIRAAVGQEPLEVEVKSENKQKDLPKWTKSEPKETIDANELLDKEINPLAYSDKILKSLNKGEFIIIKADFRPEPLIDEFEKKGYEVAVKEIDENNFLTYIKK